MTSTSGSAYPEKFHAYVYISFSHSIIFFNLDIPSGAATHLPPPQLSWQEYKIFAFSSKIFIFPSRMAKILKICIFIKDIHIFIKNGKNAKYLHFHIFINNGKNKKYMSFDGSLTFTFNFKDVAKVMCKILGTYFTNANNYPYKYYKHMQTNTD